MDQGQNDNKKLTNQAKDLARKQAKKQMGRMAKIIVTKITGLLAVLFTQFWWVIALTVLGGMILDFAVEIISAKNTPEEIASKLEIDGDTMASLVEVKGDDKSGYYLSFAEDTDAKLDEIVKDFNSKAGVRNIPNKEFLKKIIKAEVITQFPNLGGNIPNGEDGFQGSVKIRRVSPNKDIGEMKNTGVGETTTVGEDEVFDTNVIGNYEEVIKVWEKGRKITLRADAKVYEQTESKLNPGSDTGDWHGVYDEKTSGTLTWKKGTIVEYTGTYKNNKNPTTGDVVTYVEVKNKDKVGFVKAWFLQEAEEEKEQLEKEENDKSQPNENEEEGKKEATIVKTTARAKNNGKEKIGGTKSEYVVAIAAGHSKEEPGAEGNGLNEEVLTIEVAEKVEELIKQKYSNVKVVQTGSTANKGVKAEERKQLAREANPDLCIQIHFNSATSADATGVEVIYKKNDGISQQLAEILTKSISTEMGLTDRGAAADVDRAAVGSLGIIENAALSGFPSVVTEGGFISGTNDSQVIKNGGVEKYAEGIVKGIKEYLEADHSGYTSTAPEEITETESINSIVQNLKYVPQEKMREYIDNNDKKALELFSLDEEQNLITATWNKTADGKVSITENAPMNLKNALNKYVLPYEYLLYFYIDIDDMEFSDALADKVINDTEIVIALQDNVTTNKSVITKQERREDEQPSKSFDWRDTSSVRTEISETCSTTVSITYVDTWCVKAYQKNSFSDKFLNMGNQDKKEINIPGTVTETKSQIIGNEVKDKTVTYTEVKKVPVASNNSNASEAGKYEEIEETYTYTTYTREKTDSHTISNTYDQGEKKIQGKENVFCELYKEFNMIKRVRTSYLFNILSNNDRTANLLDLTKYLIYKATNVSYGVVEFDFSIFDQSSFSGMMGFYGGTIEEKVWFALRDSGYSEIVTAGIMGNIWQESKFKPEIVNSSSGATGICQWLGGRLDGLRRYAQSKGVEPTDADTQIEFLLTEINKGSGPAAGYAGDALMANKGYGKYSFKEQTTIEGAVKSFCWTFERPGDGEANIPARIEAANRYYNQFKGKTKPSFAGGVSNQAEADALNQIIMNEWIHTKMHYRTGQYQDGPFLKYWTSPYNLLQPFQCTWWANGRASMYLEQYGTKYKKYPTQMGNGGDYYNENVKGGWFNYGSQPRPNSIISWRNGSYGHVGYVEGVGSDGTVYVSEAGSGLSWLGVNGYPNGKYYSGYTLNGYVYLDSPK